MTDKNIETLARYKDILARHGDIYFRGAMSKKLIDAQCLVMHYLIGGRTRENVLKDFSEAKRYCSLLEECGLEVNKYQSQINILENQIKINILEKKN